MSWSIRGKGRAGTAELANTVNEQARTVGENIAAELKNPENSTNQPQAAAVVLHVEKCRDAILRVSQETPEGTAVQFEASGHVNGEGLGDFHLHVYTSQAEPLKIEPAEVVLEAGA